MQPEIVLAFGIVLIVAVLVSAHAHETVLSTAVLFLLCGFLVGDGALGWVHVGAEDDTVRAFAELALFAILFVDGAELSMRELGKAWRLPGRALIVGLPITLGLIALAGKLFFGLTWTEAILVGAILSPTDPVLVATILGREAVPLRLRRLLSVESGLNDGLALPIVMVALAYAGHERPSFVELLLDGVLGVGVGIVVPLVFSWLEERSVFGAAPAYRSLAGVAIALVLFGLTRVLGLNEFLAAFAGGVALASNRPGFARDLRRFGAPLAEIGKLSTIFLFGSLLSVRMLAAPGPAGLAFAAVALLAARPVALLLALRGAGLQRKEWLAAAWFGPKGFASLLYALLMLHAGLSRGEFLFQIVALVIAISIAAHSSSDAPLARAFRTRESTPDDGREHRSVAP